MSRVARVLTAAEAALHLKVTPSRVRDLCREGRLGKRHGFTWIISEEELRQFLKVRRPVGRPPRK